MEGSFSSFASWTSCLLLKERPWPRKRGQNERVSTNGGHHGIHSPEYSAPMSKIPYSSWMLLNGTTWREAGCSGASVAICNPQLPVSDDCSRMLRMADSRFDCFLGPLVVIDDIAFRVNAETSGLITRQQVDAGHTRVSPKRGP